MGLVVNLADAESPIRERMKLNKAELAEAFGMSPQAVDGWIRRGCPAVQRGARGTPWIFDVLEVARWRYAASDAAPAVNPDEMTPQDRKAWFDSEAKRRDLQERDRELVRAADLERAVATAFAGLSQELLSLPDRIERRCGLEPETVELIAQTIQQSMQSMSEQVASLTVPPLDEDADVR